MKLEYKTPRKKWTQADIRTVIDCVNDARAQHKIMDWDSFREIFPDRTPKACRTIWDKHKNPRERKEKKDGK